MFYHNNKSIKLFADGANLDAIERLSLDPLIDGITTNPTLMRASGVTNYMSFCRRSIQFSRSKPISFEVFSDDLDEMKAQAYELSSLSPNVYVKVPITNSLGVSTDPIITQLLHDNVPVNITAVMSLNQIELLHHFLPIAATAYISIFAGRIADTGRDPKKYVTHAISKFSLFPNVEILWASTREVYNIYEALDIGCHIITTPPSIIDKTKYRDYSLEKFSLDTVKMFKADSEIAGYVIPVTSPCQES